MTDEEIIDQILYRMTPGASHSYYWSLWKQVTNPTPEGFRWEVMVGSRADVVLKKMGKRGDYSNARRRQGNRLHITDTYQQSEQIP